MLNSLLSDNTSFQLNIQSSSIEDLQKITFDAEYSISLRGDTVITSYPTEEGFNIQNGIINRPDVFRVRLGIGTKPLTSIFSDPLAAINQNWTSYISNYLLNFINSGVATIIASNLAQKLKGSLITPDSRQGKIFVMLQVIRLTGQEVNLVVHNIGTLNNYLIKSVEFSRDVRDDIAFDITLQQRIGKTNDTRTITTASEIVNLGQASIKEFL